MCSRDSGYNVWECPPFLKFKNWVRAGITAGLGTWGSAEGCSELGTPHLGTGSAPGKERLGPCHP